MWRLWILCSACSFTSHGAVDAPPADPDAPPIDAPPDASARSKDGLVAFYTFDERSGALVHDTAGVAPALDVTIADPALVEWSVGALEVNETTPVQIASAGPPTLNSRLTTSLVMSNAVTVEAWVTSNVASQTGPTPPGGEESARVLTLSLNAGRRNFAIGQRGTVWQGQVRSSKTDDQGNPPLRGGLVTTNVQHLVLTADATTRRLYVDGMLAQSDTLGGTFGAWETAYRLAFGAEVSLNNQWNGRLLMVAIYNRVLGEPEILLNRMLGPDAP